MTYVSDMSTRLSGMDWDMVASTGANNKETQKVRENSDVQYTVWIVSWLLVVFPG